MSQPGDPAKHGRGRPSLFTEERAETILQLVRAGNPTTVAAAYAGVHDTTVAHWAARGRYDEAAGRDTRLSQFATAYARARAQAIAARIQRISAAGAAGDWRADAWWLERVVPEFSPKERLQVAGDAREPVRLVVEYRNDWRSGDSE